MEITDIVQTGVIITGIGVASVLLGISLDIAYATTVRRRQGKDKIENFPLYAQELSKMAKRTMEISEKKGTLRGNLHYMFCEIPTFKAVYNFLTLNNPKYRGLFFN